MKVTVTPANVDARDVRAWARLNGYAVKDRGRFPAAVLEAYLAADGFSRLQAKVGTADEDPQAVPF